MVARLVLINGAPGTGKSTLAQRYVDRHPLTLNLDIDWVRALLGDWRGDETGAGLLARALSLAMARTHLSSGHDVLVPQYLGRLGFICELEGLAGEVGARFHEIVLLDTAVNSVRRFVERSAAAVLPEHVEAAELVARSGGDPALRQMHARLLEVVSARPASRIIRSRHGDVEQAYRQLLACLADPAG